MANYLIAISGHEGTNWQIKGTALACYSFATLSEQIPPSNNSIEALYSRSPSSGLQHKVRLLVLKRRRRRQNLYLTLRHCHRLCGPEWSNFCREP